MASAREQVNQWLLQYGQRIGKHFQLRDGVFAATDSDDQEYVVDVPENASHVYFCAPIATLNNVVCKEKNLQCCLQWNLYGQETQGGTLSYEESTDRIIFHKAVPIEHMNEFSFQENFDCFIQSVLHIQDLWKEYQQTAPLEVSSSQEAIDPVYRI